MKKFPEEHRIELDIFDRIAYGDLDTIRAARKLLREYDSPPGGTQAELANSLAELVDIYGEKILPELIPILPDYKDIKAYVIETMPPPALPATPAPPALPDKPVVAVQEFKHDCGCPHAHMNDKGAENEEVALAPNNRTTPDAQLPAKKSETMDKMLKSISENKGLYITGLVCGTAIVISIIATRKPKTK